MARMRDLPEKLVGEKILARVPITSLKAVRSTCKTWEAISKKWVLGKEAASPPHQFLGFVMMNFKVYSLSFHLRKEEEEEDVVCVKQVDLLNQLEISKLYHCDGLVLCVAKEVIASASKSSVAKEVKLKPRLVVWNPYLCQTRWIAPRGESFNRKDKYAIGYSNVTKERNHKILRFVEDYSGSGLETIFQCEIYEIRSNSWRFLKVNKKNRPNWEIDWHQRGVSVKGNTYFFAHQRYDEVELDEDGAISEVEDFLLCFDFTKERFGPRLTLPFHSYDDDCITLSSLGDEQLAVLFGSDVSNIIEIWVTLTVEPQFVSWSKFLVVETGPDFKLESLFGGSFFLDEVYKVAVVFELDGYLSTPLHHLAYVFGQNGYFKSLNLADAAQLQHLCPLTGVPYKAALPSLVCSSSYLPSLVPLKHKSKRKRKAAPV